MIAYSTVLWRHVQKIVLTKLRFQYIVLAVVKHLSLPDNGTGQSILLVYAHNNFRQDLTFETSIIAQQEFKQARTRAACDRSGPRRVRGGEDYRSLAAISWWGQTIERRRAKAMHGADAKKNLKKGAKVCKLAASDGNGSGRVITRPSVKRLWVEICTRTHR
jgi:hypothetical protein